MPRATCRCGAALEFEPHAERVDCAACGARVKIRHREGTSGATRGADGFLRFHCPCGRRLKVAAASRPTHGKCPDCGRVVPVPDAATGVAARSPLAVNDPERRTEELPAADADALQAWIRRHQAAEARAAPAPASPPARAAAPTAVEAGLRICPGCGRPVHLAAETCRHCGSAVPRR